MSAVTTGVAIPSLRPLSTFKERRIDCGSDASDTTLALSAASVGASTAPNRAASSHGRSVKSSALSPNPIANVSGRPMARSRVGRPALCRRSWRLTRERVSEQQQGQRDFRQSVDGTRLDRDVDPGPGSVAQHQAGDNEHDRSGDIESLQPARQQRPADQQCGQRDQRVGVHAGASSLRVDDRIRRCRSSAGAVSTVTDASPWQHDLDIVPTVAGRRSQA